MSLLLNLPPSQTLSYNSLTLLRHFVKLHRNQHGASVLSVTVADQRKLESLLFATTSLSPSPLFRSTASLFLLSSGFCFEERGGEVVIVERLSSYVSARQKQDKKKSSPSTRRNCARVVSCRSGGFSRCRVMFSVLRQQVRCTSPHGTPTSCCRSHGWKMT
jgi:hypothetical protein